VGPRVQSTRAPAAPRHNWTPGLFVCMRRYAVANSTGSINVASSASAFELLTRLVDDGTFPRTTKPRADRGADKE
jgi:hypothetical protein